MTKIFKSSLIGLLMLVMTAFLGFAVVGLNKTVVNAESTTYDIKILGTALSDSNLTFDSSDDANVTGSVTYSPEENKLTLNNFVFNGPSGDHIINVVSSTSTTLTVELIGDSEITITENTSSWSKAISAFYTSEKGTICFVGGGSFTVDNSAFDSSTAALHASSKNIFVYNSQLVGKGYETAIYYADFSFVGFYFTLSLISVAISGVSRHLAGVSVAVTDYALTTFFSGYGYTLTDLIYPLVACIVFSLISTNSFCMYKITTLLTICCYYTISFHFCKEKKTNIMQSFYKIITFLTSLTFSLF